MTQSAPKRAHWLPLSLPQDLQSKHKAAVSGFNRPKSTYNGRLGSNALDSVVEINNA